MKVIVFVIVLVGSEARRSVLRCHATPKMNFFHLGIFIYFANSEIAISTILLVQSKKYFSLITILLYAEKS